MHIVHLLYISHLESHGIPHRYLLQRAAGIVDLNIVLGDSETPDRGHLLTFLKMALPQLSAVFALHRVALTLSLQEAGKLRACSVFHLRSVTRSLDNSSLEHTTCLQEPVHF